MLNKPIMLDHGQIMLSKVPESHNIVSMFVFNIKLHHYFKNFPTVHFHKLYSVFYEWLPNLNLQ